MPQSRRIALDGEPRDVEAFRASFPTIEHCLTSEERSGVAWPALSYLQGQVLPPIVSGVDFPDHESILPTGDPEMDAVLEGGLRGGQLVELTGASGSGKTHNCHLMAAKAAHSAAGGRVIYVDTSNSFSADKLASMVPKADQQSVLAKITVFRPHDIFQVLGIVDHLGVEMSHIEERQLRPVLIILDSVSAVVSPILGGGGPHKQGHTLMVGLGRALKALALGFDIPVLCTNHEVGSLDQRTRPALGEHWTNQVTVRIRLTKESNNVERVKLVRASDAAVCT